MVGMSSRIKSIASEIGGSLTPFIPGGLLTTSEEKKGEFLLSFKGAFWGGRCMVSLLSRHNQSDGRGELSLLFTTIGYGE